MIDTKGMVSVAEAAKRLDRSIEQVRRNLRDGKLRGQRIGNQWFVDETCLEPAEPEKEFKPLIPPELFARIVATREAIFRENGIVYDAVEMVREHRDSR